ncbi:MAG: hypothetical protein JO273_11635 [Methylobacteriaceae bacterium]|nr:hypothetical protein [Methylobacteriaceae bacterium]
MEKIESPSPRGLSEAFQFLIGTDSHGNWVVQDRRGRCGGLFVSRNEALRFAMFENGYHPNAVMMVPGVLELRMPCGPRAVAGPALGMPTARQAA